METLEPSQHSLADPEKTRKTCVEVAGRRNFRISSPAPKVRTAIHTYVVETNIHKNNKYTFICIYTTQCSQVSVVGATCDGLKVPRLESRYKLGMFLSLKNRPDWFWDPRSLLLNGHHVPFSANTGRSVKFTTPIRCLGWE